MIAYIHFGIDEYEHEAIVKAAKNADLTIKDFIIRCVVEYCDNHKQDIVNSLKLNCAKHENKSFVRNCFHFKNARKRIYQAIEWQLFLPGRNVGDASDIDIPVVSCIVDNALKEYDFLPDLVKKVLARQKKEFEELKNPAAITRLSTSYTEKNKKETRWLK